MKRTEASTLGQQLVGGAGEAREASQGVGSVQPRDRAQAIGFLCRVPDKTPDAQVDLNFR